MVNTSDRPVRTPLFLDRISNCTNLFRPNPNQTRHKITSFVSVIVGNLDRGRNTTHIVRPTVRRHYVV